jgi:hypothetical protein
MAWDGASDVGGCLVSPTARLEFRGPTPSLFLRDGYYLSSRSSTFIFMVSSLYIGPLQPRVIPSRKSGNRRTVLIYRLGQLQIFVPEMIQTSLCGGTSLEMTLGRS